MNYLDLFVQILTAIICLFYYLRHRTKFLFIITLLMSFSAIVEAIGEYTVLTGKSSFFVYQFFSVFQFTLIYKIYTELINGKKLKTLFTILHSLFLLFGLITFFNSSLFFYSIILGAFNTSLFIMFYLRDILMSIKILNYRDLLPFWISVGFLVFFMPSIPFFSLFEDMQNRNLFFILNILVILKNLFIIYGLVCSNKEEKYL